MEYFIRQHTFTDGSIYIECTCNPEKLIQPSSYNAIWGVAYRKCGEPNVKILEQMDIDDMNVVRQRKQKWIDGVPKHLLLNERNAYAEDSDDVESGSESPHSNKDKEVPTNWWGIYDADGNLEHVCRSLWDCYNWAALHTEVTYNEKGEAIWR